MRRWLAGTPRGLKGNTARVQFASLAPLLIGHLAGAENPDAALVAFDRFLANLHGGARLFSLLRQNPDLVALVARLLGTAPRLADTLAEHPQVLDALIDPAFFGALPSPERLAGNLADSLAEARSHEEFLDRVRLFGQEQMFLIGARILSGTVSARAAGEAFAALADTILRALHRKVALTLRAVHGDMPGSDAAVLAMGKLGGREMTANSDLDLIVVYDFDPARAELRWGAAPPCRAIFRSLYTAPDQRPDHAHQSRPPLSRRHAVAPVGPFRTAGDIDCVLRELSAPGGMDLGTHGIDAGARGVVSAGFCGAGRGCYS